MTQVPHDGRVLTALWYVYTEQGLHEKALAAASAVPADSPLARRARFDVALSLIELKRLDGACKELTALYAQARGAARVERARHRSASPGPRDRHARSAGRRTSSARPPRIPTNTDYLFNLGYARALAGDDRRRADRASRGRPARRGRRRCAPRDERAARRLGDARRRRSRELDLARLLGHVARDGAGHARRPKVPPGLERRPNGSRPASPVEAGARPSGAARSAGDRRVPPRSGAQARSSEQNDREAIDRAAARDLSDAVRGRAAPPARPSASARRASQRGDRRVQGRHLVPRDGGRSRSRSARRCSKRATRTRARREAERAVALAPTIGRSPGVAQEDRRLVVTFASRVHDRSELSRDPAQREAAGLRVHVGGRGGRRDFPARRVGRSTACARSLRLARRPIRGRGRDRRPDAQPPPPSGRASDLSVSRHSVRAKTRRARRGRFRNAGLELRPAGHAADGTADAAAGRCHRRAAEKPARAKAAEPEARRRARAAEGRRHEGRHRSRRVIDRQLVRADSAVSTTKRTPTGRSSSSRPRAYAAFVASTTGARRRASRCAWARSPQKAEMPIEMVARLAQGRTEAVQLRASASLRRSARRQLSKFGHPAFAWMALSPLIVAAALATSATTRSSSRTSASAVSPAFCYFGGTLYWVVPTSCRRTAGCRRRSPALVGLLLVSYLALFVGFFALLVGIAVRRFGVAGVWLAPLVLGRDRVAALVDRQRISVGAARHVAGDGHSRRAAGERHRRLRTVGARRARRHGGRGRSR